MKPTTELPCSGHMPNFEELGVHARVLLEENGHAAAVVLQSADERGNIFDVLHEVAHLVRRDAMERHALERNRGLDMHGERVVPVLLVQTIHDEGARRRRKRAP